MSGFRLMGGRNKTRDAARERSNANHSCRSRPQRPAEISNQFSSLGPVAPAPLPQSPSHGQEGKFSYTRRTTLNPSAPRQPGRARGLGWLGRSSHTWACAAGIHACAAGIALAPRRCVWFQIGKAHPRPRPLRAQRMAGLAGLAGEVRGGQFPELRGFPPTVHAADSS